MTRVGSAFKDCKAGTLWLPCSALSVEDRDLPAWRRNRLQSRTHHLFLYLANSQKCENRTSINAKSDLCQRIAIRAPFGVYSPFKRPGPSLIFPPPIAARATAAEKRRKRTSRLDATGEQDPLRRISPWSLCRVRHPVPVIGETIVSTLAVFHTRGN